MSKSVLMPLATHVTDLQLALDCGSVSIRIVESNTIYHEILTDRLVNTRLGLDFI